MVHMKHVENGHFLAVFAGSQGQIAYTWTHKVCIKVVHKIHAAHKGSQCTAVHVHFGGVAMH